MSPKHVKHVAHFVANEFAGGKIIYNGRWWKPFQHDW